MADTYIITRRSARYLALFQTRDLDELARAVAAQPDPEALEIYVNDGALNRPLTDGEQSSLRALTHP